MKFQLLASVLIASIASSPVAAPNTLNYVGRKPIYPATVPNRPGSVKYNSPNYVSKQPTQQQTSPSQNKLKYRSRVSAAPASNQRPRKANKSPELENLFQQIEALNNIAETEGDNLDAWKTFKTSAKGVFDGAKKFYNSPAGQKTREVVKVLL